MKRLISKETIGKYLIPNHRINGIEYGILLQYTDEIVSDCHVAKLIMANKNSGRGYSGILYLPSVDEATGLVRRNHVMWYHVNMVIPPIVYKTTDDGKLRTYTDGLIGRAKDAKKLSDFFPISTNAVPAIVTPAMKECVKRCAEIPVIDDLSKWNVVTMDVAIIEMINYKIRDDALRSQRGGFTGLSASVKAVHTLINAFMRYHGEDESDIPDDIDRHEEDVVLGRPSIVDKHGVLVLSPLAKSIDLEYSIGAEDRCPVDFVSCSSNKPVVSGRLKDGVHIENCGFAGKPTFPYTQWRRSVPGIKSDDPRRLVVSRSITRSLRLSSPDKPKAETEVVMNIDSLSLPGIRITHPLTYEDGIIVSETMAHKMAAYKVLSDRFQVSQDSSMCILKRPCDWKSDYDELRALAENATTGSRQIAMNSMEIVHPGDTIATVVTPKYKEICTIEGLVKYSSKVLKKGQAVIRESSLPADTSIEHGRIYPRRIVHTEFLGKDKRSVMLTSRTDGGGVAVLEDEDFDLLEYICGAKNACAIVNPVEETENVLELRLLELETKERDIKSKLRHIAVVKSVEEFEEGTDIESELKSVRITYLAYIPLRVGDKVADAHGNKSTVSMILSDNAMPVWTSSSPNKCEAIRCHYIANPYLMKRLAIGSEIEDRISVIAARLGADITVSIDSDDQPTLEESMSLEYWNSFDFEEDEMLTEDDIELCGTVTYRNDTFQDVPISYRRMFRLDNLSSEVVSSRPGVLMKDGVRTGKNARLSLEIVTLQSRGALNLSHRLIEDSHCKEIVDNRIKPLLWTLYGTFPEEYKDPKARRLFEIDRRLDRSLLGNPVSETFISSLDLKGTAADPRAVDHWGYIRRDGKVIAIMPPHSPLNSLHSGLVMVDRISVEANKVISDVISEEFTRRYPSDSFRRIDIDTTVDKYLSFIAGTLVGKNGLMRECIMPVFPHTIRAVATPYLGNDNDPLEIAIPRREFRRMIKRSVKLADKYGHYTTDNFCLLKRDPVHREQNVITVRFVTWEHDSIGISPLLIRSLDGDYDGDAVTAMFPTTIVEMVDLIKTIPKFEDIFSPGKQLEGVSADDAISALRENVGWCSTFCNPHETDVLKNAPLFEKLRRGMSNVELARESIPAIRDFEIIKDGTALVGATALQFIYSRCIEKPELLKEAMELYHLLAQDTLDAKAGTEVKSMEVIRIFNRIGSISRKMVNTANVKVMLKEGDKLDLEINRMEEKMEDIGMKSKECVEEFINMAIHIGIYGSKPSFFTSQNPVLGSVQDGNRLIGDSQSSYARHREAFEVAKRFAEGIHMGNGIWEKLLDYHLSSDNNSVFSIKPFNAFEGLKTLREKLQGN